MQPQLRRLMVERTNRVLKVMLGKLTKPTTANVDWVKLLSHVEYAIHKAVLLFGAFREHLEDKLTLDVADRISRAQNFTTAKREASMRTHRVFKLRV